MQRKLEEKAVDVQKYERRGNQCQREILASQFGKRATRMRTLGYGENGAETLKFLKNNEMNTLDDRANKPAPEWTRQCIQQGQCSVLDYSVENRRNKEIEVHVRTADPGTTDHCLYGQTSNRRDPSKIGAVGK